MTQKDPRVLVGAHMSASGGVHNALLEGPKYGANIIQLFTSNQRQWKAATISEVEIKLWEEARKETHITHIMSHGSYLINLGSPNKETKAKSLEAFSKELTRCHQLNIDYLNFHPGSATGSPPEKCIETIAKSLLSFEKQILEGKTLLLMESTAGQGTNIGHRFEELKAIIDLVKGKIPIGICLDTCHTFAAGYDIRTKAAWEKTLKEFDQIIGLEKYLKAFHVNDSMQDLGSRKDRHASLGEGKIGIECFKYLMTDPKVKYLPKYLETPNGETHWKNEIEMLLKFAKQK